MVWTKTFRPKRTPTYDGGPLVLGNSEKRVALQLKAAGVPYAYEKAKLKYHVAKDCTYTPDFCLDNGMLIEVKGLFEAKDRVKHLLIKEQHPDIDLRFVFDNSSKKITKVSKTSYGDWCTKNNFKYAEKVVPTEWLN